MLDKSIPHHDLVMICYGHEPAASLPLPEGYSIVTYRDGDEQHWAQIETSVGEFSDTQRALEYWERNYRPNLAMVRQRCLFALGPDGACLGTCTAWEGAGADPSAKLHWVAVRPEAQGRGLGGALVSRALEIFAREGSFPVSLHTQTWSHRAIRLYHRLGFVLLKSCPEAWGKSRYDEAMAVLRGVYTPQQYEALASTAQDTPALGKEGTL